MTDQSNPALDERFYAKLAASIVRRYGLNADKSVWDVYQLSQDFLSLDPASLDFVSANRVNILRALADEQVCERLVDLFVQSTLEFTFAKNQFIDFTAEKERGMRGIYRQYLEAIRAEVAAQVSPEALKTGLEGAIAAHFGKLKANIAGFFDDETAGNLQANVILRQAVCHEYSPVFQLGILGLGLEDLREPVLDIGCGKSGALVEYLNRQGIRAAGVDRIVQDSPHLRKADWLRLELQPAAWGTILSHMAFSNHFTFHHLYRHGSAEAYARQYMAILAALQPGGMFTYAPGLPFIEQLLPSAAYRVERIRVGGTPDERFYVARVEKLGA